jgi:hypothetical protein
METSKVSRKEEGMARETYILSKGALIHRISGWTQAMAYVLHRE